ncbi:hypothetical protein TNCV_4456631 [Trichonephila clavipes]|nr:hypothetical protein TNCV_4456631 [Trichonephila clavipes]
MRGEEIANTVIECMDEHHIPLDKIVSISTDGAKRRISVDKSDKDHGKLQSSKTFFRKLKISAPKIFVESSKEKNV